MELRYVHGSTPEKEILQVYAETMEQLFQQDPKVVYLDADLMGSLKTSELWKKYPDHVLNTGIQEADMVGVAAGLYLAGFKPYIHSFTPFASRRVFDQLFISIAYAQKSVRVIGSDAGIAATYNGGTHMCFEDIGLMRTIPYACICDVTDAAMFKQMLYLTKDRQGVNYIRTARRGVPDIYYSDESFEIGKGKVLHEGKDATIIAAGLQVAPALDAASMLEDEGISVRVVDIVTIKPIDRDLILDSARKTGLIVTSENGNIRGGLGSAVAEVTAEFCPTHILFNGVKDRFGQVGGMDFLREQYQLRAQDIAACVRQGIQQKK